MDVCFMNANRRRGRAIGGSEDWNERLHVLQGLTLVSLHTPFTLACHVAQHPSVEGKDVRQMKATSMNRAMFLL